MATQVMRVETRGAGGAPTRGITRHVDGRSRPAGAEPRPGWDPVRSLGDERDEAARRIASAKRIKRRGGSGAPLVEFLFAGPPAFSADDAWTKERVEAWEAAAAAWVRETFPGCPVHRACAHRDERSPHAHVTIVPDAPDARGPRLAWSRVRNAAAERVAGRAPSSHVEAMSMLQDDYQSRVASVFDLARGERGSRSKHRAPDGSRGLDERKRELDERERDLAERERAAMARERRARSEVDAGRRRERDLVNRADHKRRRAERKAAELRREQTWAKRRTNDR